MNPYREPGKKNVLVRVRLVRRASIWKRLWHAIICGDPECPLRPF